MLGARTNFVGLCVRLCKVCGSVFQKVHNVLQVYFEHDSEDIPGSRPSRVFCRAIKSALPDLLNSLHPLCPKSKALAASHRNQSFESSLNT